MKMTLDRGIPRDTNGYRNAERLLRIVNVTCLKGHPDAPFFYLGGPMTGIPQFNFPEFQRVADVLRAAGYNIVSPAELDDPETERAALESPDGAPGSGSANGEAWEDFLGRDCVIVSMPTCVGGIFLEGWHRSSGADLESYILTALKKDVFEFREDEHGYTLEHIDRNARIAELRDIDAVRKSIEDYDGPLPKQPPRPRIVVREVDDWIAVYKDGRKVEENHSVPLVRGLEALGVPHEWTYYDSGEYDEMAVTLPDGTDLFPEVLP